MDHLNIIWVQCSLKSLFNDCTLPVHKLYSVIYYNMCTCTLYNMATCLLQSLAQSTTDNYQLILILSYFLIFSLRMYATVECFSLY